MTDSIDITFTSACHAANQTRTVAEKIRVLPGVRRVFYSAKGQGDDTCCAVLNGTGVTAEIVEAILGIEGVATTKAQTGHGYVPNGI